jgi:hypothetical protein
MDMTKIMSGLLITAMVSGCASVGSVNGPRGPKIVGSGRSTGYEQYAEVGVQFSSPGDFFALVSPGRWQSPIKTGGSLSWLNPEAWSEDPGRTGRILIGEAVAVGGVVAAAAAGGGSGDGSASAGSPVDGPGTPPEIPTLPPR